MAETTLRIGEYEKKCLPEVPLFAAHDMLGITEPDDQESFSQRIWYETLGKVVKDQSIGPYHKLENAIHEIERHHGTVRSVEYCFPGRNGVTVRERYNGNKTTLEMTFDFVKDLTQEYRNKRSVELATNFATEYFPKIGMPMPPISYENIVHEAKFA